jgi:hypothetical protein
MTVEGGLASEPLICPGCGARHAPQERFCTRCRLPLVHDLTRVEPPPPTERRRRAWKIKPQLAEGRLVRAAGARNLAEAEFIQGLLLEEGIPSLLRRSAGFDVPDFLAAGPRDVLVPETGLPAAREALLAADIIGEDDGGGGRVRPGPLALGLVGALVLGLLVVWALLALVH